MKKIISFIIFICMFIITTHAVNAVTNAEAPTYDQSYNNNQGALYANGTPIRIREQDSETIIEWDGDSQVVPSTVTVFGGKVDELKSGLSNGSEITTDNENYSVIYVDGSVGNNNVTGSSVNISYKLEINEDDLTMQEGESKILTTSLTVTPANYEYLFNSDNVEWYSYNSNIVTVDQNGTIKAVSPGEAVIQASLLDSQYCITVNVTAASTPGQFTFSITSLIFLLVIILFIFVGFICFCCCYCNSPKCKNKIFK